MQSSKACDMGLGLWQLEMQGLVVAFGDAHSRIEGGRVLHGYDCALRGLTPRASASMG
ncbi:hypothetical protein J2S35_000332 [Falsarthrobacter nasiphocae]|uniref:Uncharacterized protein n=1 Tax=Falsarthrobacter nasiphocae TaxID=189863 RepID=A0AAE3YET9_9MICC|nr:hypothetical protein [Falsarthrobacter nasiphocae]